MPKVKGFVSFAFDHLIAFCKLHPTRADLPSNHLSRGRKQTDPAASFPKPLMHQAIKNSLWHLNVDSFVSLCYACIVNSFIFITAAAATLRTQSEVATVEDTYSLLDYMLGKPSAVIFAVGLLCDPKNMRLWLPRISFEKFEVSSLVLSPSSFSDKE